MPALDALIRHEQLQNGGRMRALLQFLIDQHLVGTRAIHAGLRCGYTKARHDDGLHIHETLGREALQVCLRNTGCRGNHDAPDGLIQATTDQVANAVAGETARPAPIATAARNRLAAVLMGLRTSVRGG